MFTGIIEEVGAVSRRSGADLEILAKTVLENLRLGDSISIDGTCLTVVALNANSFVVQLSPETLARTTLSRLQPGSGVNLERSLAVGDRMGGHFVLGHVDGVGQVERIRRQDEFSRWRFRAPSEVARYLVPKGSIAVDGISLTVVEPTKDTFDVAIIPATLAKTTLGSKRVGDPVNMEADMIGKHIYHFLKATPKESISRDFLARHGFA
ncbi:MAG: riboflavin synthase [Candidatus Hydrogenedentes bacterium]|nr:riboflavin synthase [Candidatus Hydrogenedentota bacterium]